MKRCQSILVQVDARRDEQALLARATELARVQQAALTIVDVVPEFSWPVRLAASDLDELRQAVVAQKQGAVDKLAAPIRDGGVSVTAKVLCGKSSDQIIGEVVRSGHDLVMKDAKGQYSQHPGTFGTTAMRLIRYCPCPVWAYRSRRSGSSGPDRIAVAVDVTAADEKHQELNRDIVAWAMQVSGEVTPDIAHVWSVYGESLIQDYMKRDEFEALVKDAEQEARREMEQLLQPFSVSATDSHVHLLRGEPAQELIQFVNEGNYDVLVLGTVARSGISGLLLGNTAETLINRVECSVIAIKPAGFKTPIHVA
jgi:nucleotide-binding universal stress UspA family protein